MTTELATTQEPQTLSPSDIELVKQTIAKKATDQEFKLFLARCKLYGLNPLKGGQIHFVKYDQNSPGTIVVGIDGFRSVAARTGKHCGTKRGVLYDKSGAIIGGWAEVYRSDWKEPARDEALLAEYAKNNQTWRTMPTTMIKKVAEVAALRMAFAEDLGGVYSDDEMPAAPHEAAQDARGEAIDAPVGGPPGYAAAKPSEKQLKRLFAIAKASGWSNDQVKEYLSLAHGITSTTDLTLTQYNQACDGWLPQGPHAALASRKQEAALPIDDGTGWESDETQDPRVVK